MVESRLDHPAPATAHTVSSFADCEQHHGPKQKQLPDCRIFLLKKITTIVPAEKGRRQQEPEGKGKETNQGSVRKQRLQSKRKEQLDKIMAAPAQMEATKPANDIAIFPLKCSLCPKKPKFSDMSHLLTHISSKSHLHHKFNLEFTAKKDPSAKDELARYEQWYTVNNIEAHLATRLAGKSQKKAGRRSRVTATSSRTRQSLSALDSMRMGTTASAVAASGIHTPRNLPPLGHWQTAPVSHSTMHHNGARNGYAGESAYDSPLAFKQRSSYLYTDSPGGMGYESKTRDFGGGMDSPHSTVPPSEMNTSLSGGFMDDEEQANRLKGVVWPGMDIFDAATVDQKRTRNQRKDGTALDILKSTSELITATETVWGPEGDVRKVRDIYASPSIDGSPPSTPPRKRKSRQRNNNMATPTRAPAADGEHSKKRRGGRASFAGSSAARHARAKGGKNQNDPTTAGESHPTIAPRQKSFNVYFEGSATSPGEATHNAAVDGISDNGFDQNQHARSALQNLDPNLTIRTESPTYFKNSSASSRFFESGQQTSHMPFQSQPSSYGGGFHGLNSAPISTMCSQPRNGSMYPTFHGTMFNGPPVSEPSPPTFAPVSDRRLGFPGYVMDPNNSPFGYGDQRDMSLREPGFPDQSYRGTPGLFDV